MEQEKENYCTMCATDVPSAFSDDKKMTDDRHKNRKKNYECYIILFICLAAALFCIFT